MATSCSRVMEAARPPRSRRAAPFPVRPGGKTVFSESRPGAGLSPDANDSSVSFDSTCNGGRSSTPGGRITPAPWKGSQRPQVVLLGDETWAAVADRKSVVKVKSVDLGGRR